MNSEKNYIEINKNSWNQKTAYHLKSDFYDVDGFLKGNSSLNEIELELLNDVEGKSILHLQCHFGQDTIYLGRLGDKTTCIDIYDKAIESSRKLSKILFMYSELICSSFNTNRKYS